MSSPSYQLVMRAGPTPGKSFALSQSEIVIGRDLGADIVINAAEISRRHVMLRFQNGAYLIEDLGSTNGTFINGQRLSAPHVLRPGEMIMLGEAVSLVYEAAQFDPNATMISPSSERPAGAPGGAAMPQPRPVPPPIQPVQASPAPGPSYSGQVPAGPPPQMPAQVQKSRTWLWAGVGCLVVGLCIVIVGGVVFDALDLYCTPPFDALSGFLWSCP
ncbi:MAG: FHA domain-containing protein [Anaerolineales bacterium]|nr:FHA domain-containing protein [Anaerolineales bacterium]